jgi:hypothetical protein
MSKVQNKIIKGSGATVHVFKDQAGNVNGHVWNLYLSMEELLALPRDSKGRIFLTMKKGKYVDDKGNPKFMILTDEYKNAKIATGGGQPSQGGGFQNNNSQSGDFGF